MNYIALIGMFAAVMTTISFVPQVIKSWKTKSVNDVSLIMYLVLMIGQFSWLTYGILIHSLPLIVSDFIVFVLTISMLMLKFKYKRVEDTKADA